MIAKTQTATDRIGINEAKASTVEERYNEKFVRREIINNKIVFSDKDFTSLLFLPKELLNFIQSEIKAKEEELFDKFEEILKCKPGEQVIEFNYLKELK